MAMSFMNKSGKLTHIQLDGKISAKDLAEAIKMGRQTCKKIYEVQKKALKEIKDENN